MKFLEKDLICIDFDGTNTIEEFNTLQNQIKKSHIILDNSLWEMKKNLNISKIFLHKSTIEILFIEVDIKGERYIGLYPFLSENLQKMESVKIKKKMDINSILERISESGITSLTKKEEKVLKNFGK